MPRALGLHMLIGITRFPPAPLTRVSSNIIYWISQIVSARRFATPPMKIRLDARLRTATVGAQAARRIVCGTQFPAGCLAQSIRTVPSGMLRELGGARLSSAPDRPLLKDLLKPGCSDDGYLDGGLPVRPLSQIFVIYSSCPDVRRT